MRLIVTQGTPPTYVQWIASLGYLLIISVILIFVWKKYKNKDNLLSVIVR